MKKIAIVSDSSVSLTPQETKKYDVYIVPNIIMHNNDSYLDQVTISNKEVNELLKTKEKLSTSQANIGTMIETFDAVKHQGYDYIIVLSVAGVLSGAYNSFVQAAKLSNLENYSVFDTHSIAGPVQQAVRAIRQMNENGASIQEILDFVQFLFDNQVSYLFPESLKQIVASGRLSSTAAKIASLLRIKPVVYLSKTGESIEKLGIARTDKRAFDIIIDHFKKYNVKPETHDLYLLESEALKTVNEFKEQLFNKLGEFTSKIITLPAALSVHAGVGAIAIQWCPKIPA